MAFILGIIIGLLIYAAILHAIDAFFPDSMESHIKEINLVLRIIFLPVSILIALLKAIFTLRR
jgi:membrane protein DedA with SNARE-associated domain